MSDVTTTTTSESTIMMSPDLTNSRESTTTTTTTTTTSTNSTNSTDSTNFTNSTNSTNSHNSTNSTPTTNTPATSTSTSDDSESVDSEVKELIKGRESLTFGPEALTSNNSTKEQQLQKDDKSSSVDLIVTSSSNMLSISHGHGHGLGPSPFHYGNYVRLTDQQGNIFILHPNGYVTPVRQITGHIGGLGYTNMLTQQLYAQNSSQSFAAIPPPPLIHQPSHQAHQDPNGVNANPNGGHESSSRAMMMMSTSGSVAGHPPPPGLTMTPSTTSSMRSPYRKNIRKFRHLGSSSFRRGGIGGGAGVNARQSNLHEVQNSILTLAQFCGDLDLGTTNRFGNLDSTSIIINLSSANTSSRSSYRSVLHLKHK